MHCLIPPSHSARRIQCSASTGLQASLPPEEDSDDAKEGTAAHWAVSETLAGRLVDAGEMAPNGIFLTTEMMQGADMISDDIVRELKPFGLEPHQGCIEKTIQNKRVHAESWGTPDYFIVIAQPEDRFVVYLYDYKFGYTQVSVFENAQLIEYAAGILDSLPWATPDVNVEFRFRIAQPRAFHRDGAIRRWDVNASDLRGHINIAHAAAHAALGPNPVARTGDECLNCRARAVCSTLQTSTYRIADEAKKPQPLELPPVALGIELSMLRKAQKLLDARVSGLEEQALSQIRAGANVRFFAVQHSAGREQWSVPAEQVLAVASVMGLDVAKPREPMTPNQAREKGLDPAIVAQFSKRSPGAAKLVEQDDTDAKRIFG